MRVRSKALSDPGRKRDHNEDWVLADDELALFVVADGMGGHAGGGTASRLAVETIEARVRAAQQQADGPFAEHVALTESKLPELLRTAVEAACTQIFRAAQGDSRLAGMGTTTIAMLLHDGDAYFAHVGDSRAYLVRGDLVQQISEDHSLVNEQIKAGMITPEEARHSRYRNIITRSVGFEQQVAVDIMGLRAEPGDTFLLCSDGLSNLVDDREIHAIASRPDLDGVPRALVDLANERGGDDNISVVCVRLLRDEP